MRGDSTINGLNCHCFGGDEAIQRACTIPAGPGNILQLSCRIPRDSGPFVHGRLGRWAPAKGCIYAWRLAREVEGLEIRQAVGGLAVRLADLRSARLLWLAKLAITRLRLMNLQSTWLMPAGLAITRLRLADLQINRLRPAESLQSARLGSADLQITRLR